MTTAFIADLHLSPERPDITAAFEAFCKRNVCLDKLYILGDLFEAWLGDDDPSEFAVHIKALLKQLVDHGVHVYFMPGNRDFMLGKKFAREVGLTLLKDETVIELNGVRTLLMHGDTLCTADRDYLRYRAVIQHPITRFLLARLPLKTRMGIAQKLRANSGTQRQLSHQRMQQMDAQHHAVVEVMNNHQVQQLIHGHTHRAAIHCFELAPERPAKRIVLGDWYDAQKIQQQTSYVGIYMA
ncbi:UDP-2,3-diacylglucosamine diphosphatase [Idiomarina sp.]|uniref:UDP-2,3-diacylglucosamine diphosphatase n=1 Tax=Idiomarina sp. TaxID=1874361 RepID=UPI0025C5651D|nr:UDP-2,3-diacylglucosamine diphosphatase [Idiomarina sp.]NQZ03664.1 UDP-2,3-diacylglucosamine diphosphatase [Idiomarina sp.]